MARGVRFTKPERAMLNKLLADYMFTGNTGTNMKIAASIAGKLKAAESAKPAGGAVGMTLAVALAAFATVLGTRLVCPPNPPRVWYIVQQKKLSNLGLNEEQAKVVASAAGAQWQGRIKVESLINQASSLLADATEGPSHSTPREDSPAGPGDLDEL